MLTNLFQHLIDVSNYEFLTLFNVVIILFTIFMIKIFYELMSPLEIEIDSEKFRNKEHNAIKRFDNIPKKLIYPNGWIPVLDSNDLSHNQIKPITACGKDLVVYRGTSGKCYIFDAYCLHLGANLGIGGTIVGESVQCPFHGWVFDQNGKCTHLPGIDSSTVKSQLNKYETTEVNGFICMWFHPTITKPDWFPEEHPKLKKENAIYRGKTMDYFTLYIQDFYENSADSTHFNVVHSAPGFLGNRLNKPFYFDLVLKILHFDSTLYWSCGSNSTKHICDAIAVLDVKLFGMKISEIRAHAHIMGSSLHNMVIEINAWKKFDFYLLHGIIQTDPFKLRTINKIYSKPGFLNRIIARFIITESAVNVERDGIIWTNKKYIQKPIITKNEKYLAEYRRWFKQFLNFSEKQI